MSHGQLLSAILFTLQMRLSYTMYSKMGPTASNSSHLPTKASFPESSSPPPSLRYPCSPLLLLVSHRSHSTLSTEGTGLQWLLWQGSMQTPEWPGVSWWSRKHASDQGPVVRETERDRVEPPGRCLTGEAPRQREQGPATAVESITWTRCEGRRVQRWTHVSHAVLD